jgi:hypothetical protein
VCTAVVPVDEPQAATTIASAAIAVVVIFMIGPCLSVPVQDGYKAAVDALGDSWR